VSLFISTPPTPAELLRVLVTRPRTALALMALGAAATKAQKAFRRGDFQAAMRTFGGAVLNADPFTTLSEERLQQVFDNVKTDRAQLLGAGFPPLRDEQVRGVQVPVLLLQSENGATVFKRLIERLMELLPNAECGSIPDASHIMQEDNPNAFNPIVLDFLKRVSAPVSSV
jgi:pimeloyl-ACP methyl ester carboxylesterase